MPWNLVYFCKTTIIRELSKCNESKFEKYCQNHWDFVGIFTCDWKCVSMCACMRICVCVCVGYSCIILCVYV